MTKPKDFPEAGTRVVICEMGVKGRVATITPDDRVVVLTDYEEQLTLDLDELEWVREDNVSAQIRRLEFGDKQWIALSSDVPIAPAILTDYAAFVPFATRHAVGFGDDPNEALRRYCREISRRRL